MSNDMNKAFNTQLNNEFYSAYVYLSMAAYFKSRNLLGFGKWFEYHAKEEMIHAMKMYNFIIDRNWQVNLLPIKAPEKNWNSPVEILAESYKQEQEVTKMINNLVKLSIDTNDYASQVFLQWFVSEQVEEEMIFDEVLDKLKLAGDSSAALLFIDDELGERASTN